MLGEMPIMESQEARLAPASCAWTKVGGTTYPHWAISGRAPSFEGTIVLRYSLRTCELGQARKQSADRRLGRLCRNQELNAALGASSVVPKLSRGGRTTAAGSDGEEESRRSGWPRHDKTRDRKLLADWGERSCEA